MALGIRPTRRRPDRGPRIVVLPTVACGNDETQPGRKAAVGIRIAAAEAILNDVARSPQQRGAGGVAHCVKKHKALWSCGVCVMVDGLRIFGTRLAGGDPVLRDDWLFWLRAWVNDDGT